MEYYDRQQAAQKIGISTWTLRTWYLWQSRRLRDGAIDKPYLPEPQVIPNRKGNPKGWTDEMIKELKKYKDSIVVGRNGVFGDLSNPLHKETKRYKKEQEEKNNG